MRAGEDVPRSTRDGMGAYGHWPRATGTRSSSSQSALSPHELPLPDEGRNVRRHDSEMRVIVAAGCERLAVPRVPPPRYRIIQSRDAERSDVLAFRAVDAVRHFAPYRISRRLALRTVKS